MLVLGALGALGLASGALGLRARRRRRAAVAAQGAAEVPGRFAGQAVLITGAASGAPPCAP